MKRRLILLFLLGIFISGCGRHVSQYIAVYGDSRTGHEMHREIVKAIIRHEPAVVFHTGDLIEGSRADWDIFNEITAEMRESAEFYPAIGNHDYYGGLDNYFDNFELPGNERWYSVEREGIHFIILDSAADIREGSAQLEWLKQDLQKIGKNIKFTIPIFHHPPITSGYKPAWNWDSKPWTGIVLPLFEKYGVDVIFNGHSHAYERCLYNGIHYVATGGGGASLYAMVEKCPYSEKYISAHHFCLLHIEGNRLFVDVLDKDSNLIDQFGVTCD